jgi:hypothetical protein
MIISKVLGECPRCGRSGMFGVCTIAGNHVVKGCSGCGSRKSEDLPKLNKHILYLDQCFLSAIFRDDDKQLAKAGKWIGKLARYQQVVSPFSDVHEVESLQWIPEQRAKLFKFIKQTARGHRFNMESEVKAVQLCRSLKQYLGHGEKCVALRPEDALPTDLHGWDSYMWVDTMISLEDPEETRAIKRDCAEGLVALFKRWKNERLLFKELVRHETQGAARMYLSLLADTVKRWKSCDPVSFMYGSQSGEMMLQLLAMVHRRTGQDDATPILVQYLDSEYFSSVPCIGIATSLTAKLRQRVQQGDYGNHEKAKDTFLGFFHDVAFISTYGPYCDAMFVDNTMRQWLEEKDVRFAERYNTRLFSKSNVDDFIDWLRDIEARIPEDVRRAADELY